MHYRIYPFFFLIGLAFLFIQCTKSSQDPSTDDPLDPIEDPIDDPTDPEDPIDPVLHVRDSMVSAELTITKTFYVQTYIFDTIQMTWKPHAYWQFDTIHRERPLPVTLIGNDSIRFTPLDTLFSGLWIVNDKTQDVISFSRQRPFTWTYGVYGLSVESEFRIKSDGRLSGTGKQVSGFNPPTTTKWSFSSQ